MGKATANKKSRDKRQHFVGVSGVIDLSSLSIERLIALRDKESTDLPLKERIKLELNRR